MNYEEMVFYVVLLILLVVLTGWLRRRLTRDEAGKERKPRDPKAKPFLLP